MRGTSLGRVVFTTRAMPAIRPVNHLIDAHRIIIRSGWCMTPAGTARLVPDPAAVSRYQQALQPWMAGLIDRVIAITPGTITGIRLREET